MRSVRANFNQIAVSAYAKETAINTYKTLDLSLLAQTSDLAQNDYIRQNNADEMTGREEPDTVYDMGKTSSLSLNFPKAQPQHFALLYGYALGSVASAAAGSGYKKTITPSTYDLDRFRSLPSLTVAQRYGKTVFKERFASMFVDQVTSKFAKGDWVGISAQLKGTGRSETSITEEVVSAAENATTLTLAANAVDGSTADERLDSIHQIMCDLSTAADGSRMKEVAFSAVSAAEPAVITIAAPGTAVTVRPYTIIYAAKEPGSDWRTFPARVSQTPLKVSGLTVHVGGWYSVADGYVFGPRLFGCEVNSLEHNLNNNGQIEFCVGSSGAYGARYFKEGRTQSLKLDREARDYVLRAHIDAGRYFACMVRATGEEYETGHNYEIELIFPRCAVLNAPLSVNGKRLAEAGDLQILEDITSGSIIVNVKDLAATYAA